MHRTTIITMTRERTWGVTAIAVALFVLISLIFLATACSRRHSGAVTTGSPRH